MSDAVLIDLRTPGVMNVETGGRRVTILLSQSADVKNLNLNEAAGGTGADEAGVVKAAKTGFSEHDFLCKLAARIVASRSLEGDLKEPIFASTSELSEHVRIVMDNPKISLVRVSKILQKYPGFLTPFRTRNANGFEISVKMLKLIKSGTCGTC